MNKSQLAFGAIIASSALILVGCSSSGGGSSSGGKITLQEIDDYIPASPQGVAIDWLFSQYHKAFPNITIKKTGIPANELQKLQAQATTNSLPDIAMIDNPNYPILAATGKLRSIPLASWGLQNAYIKGAQQVVTDKQGNVGGVFIGTNTLAVLYNKDMFAKAGITTPPTTWDEFLADGKKLATPGVTGFMFSAQNNGCSAWQFNPWQWTAGGTDTTLTDPGNVKALSFLTSLVQQGVSSKDVVNQCQDQGMNALVQGQTAMIENGPWSFSTLNAASNLKWGSFPIPVPTAGDKLIVPLGGEVWTLPKTGSTANEKAAEDFLKWSQTPAILQEFDSKLGYVPVMTSLWPATEKANPAMTSFIDSLKFARGRTTLLGTKTPNQVAALGTAIQQSILGQDSPKAALTSAQTQFSSQ
jgi:multiple sugar transport system substrate-binding protein